MKILVALSIITFHSVLSIPIAPLRIKRGKEISDIFLGNIFILLAAPQFFNGANPFLSGLGSIFGNLLPETETGSGGSSIGVPSFGVEGAAGAAGEFGSALGAAAFQAANQILNPCRPDNRFLSQQDVVSAGQGFLSGLNLINSVLGNPCAG